MSSFANNRYPGLRRRLLVAYGDDDIIERVIGPTEPVYVYPGGRPDKGDGGNEGEEEGGITDVRVDDLREYIHEETSF